jgi:hypothetical protein
MENYKNTGLVSSLTSEADPLKQLVAVSATTATSRGIDRQRQTRADTGN